VVNWTYTLWKREYDEDRKVFVSKVTMGGPGSSEEGSLEQLAEHYHKHKQLSHNVWDVLTFDEHDFITTIPAVFRVKKQYTDKPAEIEDILRFEEILDKTFNS
jgi:hypothetical protein